jgi:hypothetical protein
VYKRVWLFRIVLNQCLTWTYIENGGQVGITDGFIRISCGIEDCTEGFAWGLVQWVGEVATVFRTKWRGIGNFVVGRDIDF